MRSSSIRFAAVGLLLFAACSPEAATSDGELDVDVVLPQDSYLADEPVLADVTITNNTDQPIELVSWTLPAPELEQDIFDITRDTGELVGWRGPIFKRAAPETDDMVTLAPYASVTARVDLARFYDFSTDGTYTISVALAGAISNTQTVWIAAHEELAYKAPTPDATLGSLSFVKCSATQQSQIAAAAGFANTMSDDALAYLTTVTPSGTARYQTWFGSFSAAGWDQADTHFASIADVFDTKAITLDCGCKKPRVYAYVQPTQPYVIYLCRAFWAAPPSGHDSRAGTLIHEVSHFNVVASTNDWAYGESACKALAISDPTKALNNADSHEYFAENTPALP